ncbi:MAG: putative lipid II flippase FtsW [Chloroflexota bacterium]
MHQLRRLRQLRAPWRALPRTRLQPDRGGAAIASIAATAKAATDTSERRAGRVRPGQADYLLLVATVMLLILGLLAVYTASFAVAYNDFGDANFFVKRQVVFAVVGLCALVFFMQMDYQRLRQLSVPMLLIALVLLLLVLTPVGVGHNGARRWLDFGPIEFQPSEFAKLAIIVYISAWLSSRGSDITKFSLGFVPFVILLGVIGALIISEPDMGTTIIIVLVACTLFFVAGAPISHLALLLAVGALMSTAIILTRDYQVARFSSFLSAEADPQGNGFQVLQLLIALGSGGPFGLGWAESRQKHLYVPGSQTDGVFAILGEELGFIGLLFILAIFAFFIYRGLRVTLRSRDSFALLLGIGIVSWIGYQTIINIAGITRTIPLTGVPLPFLSYGGSALVMVMAAIGILLSISRYSSETSYVERESESRERFRGTAQQSEKKRKRRRAGPAFDRELA